ncbi:MAG: hypothetical protein QM736_15265 [Vicinamibacterales bacterium]
MLDEGTRRQVMDALRAHFRPEFLNRVDEIIFFHALGKRAHEADHRHPDRRSAPAARGAEDSRAAHRRREGLTGRGRVRPVVRRSTVEARPSSAACWIRWPSKCSKGDFGEGDTVVVDAGADGLRFEKQESVQA